LVFTPTSTFSGTANLSCAITPVVTPAPTCSLSTSSVTLSGGASQPLTVSTGTTATVTTSVVPHGVFPPGSMLLIWTVMMLGSVCLWMRTRKRLPALVAPMMVLLLASFVSCGGGGSPTSHHTTPGTPAGTYTATITATSGSVNHNMVLTLVVQ
jgi:hypothetical protein